MRIEQFSPKEAVLLKPEPVSSDKFPEQSGTGQLAAVDASGLFEGLQPALRRLLWGLLRNEAEVEDSLQATFLKLVQWQEQQKTRQAEQDSPEGPASPVDWRAWLFRVATNEALQLKRKQRTESRHQSKVAWWLGQRAGRGLAVHIAEATEAGGLSSGGLSSGGRSSEGIASGDFSAGDGSPLAAVLMAEAQQRALQALGALPEEQRQVVHLRVYENLKFSEIANRLGVPLGTVLTRMRTALGKMRAELEERT